MIALKRIGIVILVIASIQIVTFYSISENSLIKELGKNYESYVLQYNKNDFKNIGVISKLNPRKELVKKYFKAFKPYNLKICISYSDCSNLRKKNNFYLYFFDFETKNPFTTNTITEGEFAKDFGAGWQSKYIWILYKWILIEKKITGIS